MNGKRVFVSGGAGVIGRELVPKLVARGARVFVGDLKPRPVDFPSAVRYRQGDLNEMTLAEMASFAPEVFIHLAATFERSTESYGFWEENFRHNLRLGHHLMTLAKDLPSLERVVFASSYLIYDPALYQFDGSQAAPVSLHETDPVSPRNLTGMAKLAHEIELHFLEGFRGDAFSSVCARIYRGYGRGSRDVISRWVRALLAGEPIALYRPEGLFDYIYAKDTAEGLIRLAEARAVTGVVNLGTGRARRVREVVDVLRRHFPGMQLAEVDCDIPFEASQADMSHFRAATGWMPEYDLEKAIPEIVAHERAGFGRAEVNGTATGHVLVASASKKVPLVHAVQQAARKLHPAIEVHAGDTDPAALASYVADRFWQMPRTEDATIDEILEGCRERGIGTIIPTRDGELPFWARHRERFAAAGINVVVSPLSSVELCLDKLAFARFGRERGLPFIETAEHPDELGPGPYVVKERFGAGARAVGLGLDRQAALDHGARLETPIYQPCIAGREISVDAWMDRAHRVKGLVLRTRDRVVDGESQVTTTFRDPAIEAAARTVLEALELRGPAVLQLLVDARNGIHVIECNSRFGGASTASIAAGLDVFYWSLLEVGSADLDEYPFDRIEGELRQVRLPSDLHVHGPDF